MVKCQHRTSNSVMTIRSLEVAVVIAKEDLATTSMATSINPKTATASLAKALAKATINTRKRRMTTMMMTMDSTIRNRRRVPIPKGRTTASPESTARRGKASSKWRLMRRKVTPVMKRVIEKLEACCTYVTTIAE